MNYYTIEYLYETESEIEAEAPKETIENFQLPKKIL